MVVPQSAMASYLPNSLIKMWKLGCCLSQKDKLLAFVGNYLNPKNHVAHSAHLSHTFPKILSCTLSSAILSCNHLWWVGSWGVWYCSSGECQLQSTFALTKAHLSIWVKIPLPTPHSPPRAPLTFHHLLHTHLMSYWTQGGHDIPLGGGVTPLYMKNFYGLELLKNHF